MKFKLLENVVVSVDLPTVGLLKGASGTVVEICEPDGLLVEIFNADGSTLDVFAVRADQVRRATATESKSSPPS